MSLTELSTRKLKETRLRIADWAKDVPRDRAGGSLRAGKGAWDELANPLKRMNSCDTILRAGHSQSAKFTSHSRTAVAPGVAVRVVNVILIWRRSCSSARRRLLGSRLPRSVISGAGDAREPRKVQRLGSSSA